MGQRQRHGATLVVLSAAKDRIGFLGYLPAAWFTPANRTTIEALLRAELSADEVTGGLAVLGDDVAITGSTITTQTVRRPPAARPSSDCSNRSTGRSRGGQKYSPKLLPHIDSRTRCADITELPYRETTSTTEV